ncbi:MAG: hypothetical protein KDE27_24615 [Planctomycetes bacterium]|nr:hypothetical protein [Planctomycetota bacterium]
MPTSRATLVLTAALAIPVAAAGQGVDPIGRLAPDVTPLQQVDTVGVPALDRRAIALEDEQRRAAGLPARFAIATATSATTDTAGTWDDVDDAWSLWRLRIQAPGADHVNLGFTTCRLPGSARMIVHSADYSHILPPLTAANVTPDGQLWTPVVRGAEIVVEVYLPTTRRDDLDLVLGQIASGYRFFGAGRDAIGSPGGIGVDGPCDIDVRCGQGAAWLHEVSGVAGYAIGGAFLCTGALINNTAENGRLLFLTASHCGVGASSASSLVFYWNYENSSCGASDAQQLWTTAGAVIRAEYVPADMLLLELNVAPNPNWGVTWLGWQRDGDCFPAAATIHHPAGDAKKISFEYDEVDIEYSAVLINNTPIVPGTHLRVTDWDAGSTAGGSSGAPLLNPRHRIVGQLHGGAAACGNDQPDWYGRLATAWAGGGTPATRLSDWLDPLATGAQYVNTKGNSHYRFWAPGCIGSSGISTLTASTVPIGGQPFSVTVDNLPIDAAALLTGFSATSSVFGPLPLNMALFGMPLCNGYVSPDITQVIVGANGQATWSVSALAGGPLAGSRFFQQAIVFDPGASNPAGLVVSDAATGVIDGAPGGVGPPWSAPPPPTTFTVLPDLGYAFSDSAAMAVSADGKVVVGHSPNANAYQRAFAWTDAGGITDLGVLAGEQTSFASAVNADGSVIVGHCGDFNEVPFRWTAATGMQPLGPMPSGWTRVLPSGISADGTTVVGRADVSFVPRAWIWTAATGMQLLGAATSGSWAAAISTNGLFVAGANFGGSSWRWSLAAGFEVLVGLPGVTTFDDGPRAISDDGSTVIGNWGLTPYRWTDASGATPLPTLSLPLPGYNGCHAMLADAAVFVGFSADSSGLPPCWWDNNTNSVQALPAPAGSFGSEALGVASDCGEPVVVGWMTDPSTSIRRACVWR